MPRLIRDEDVDTDFPTRVGHDLLSRTHVGFPLPGEATQVDSALLFFKIARIMGQILQNLYTTTQRRGGVQKIARFQAELDMWERSLISHTPKDSSQDFEASGLETSLPLSFLRVTHCLVTIHIHRPALSFTTPHPQFSKSLEVCCSASANLIKLLCGSLRSLTSLVDSGELFPIALCVTLLYPHGAHVLWQAALTILFARWKGQPLSITEGDDDQLVQECIDALYELHKVTNNPGKDILQSAEALEEMRLKTFSSMNAAPRSPTDQLQWNVWDWPMASALEMTNALDLMPLDI